MTLPDDGRPIFQQIAEVVERSILDGSLDEGAQAPSSNELSAFYRINPATAAKGLGLLVADGILEKRRGLGMFVAVGARKAVTDKRREAFIDRFVRPMLAEARELGIGDDELSAMLHTPNPRGGRRVTR